MEEQGKEQVEDVTPEKEPEKVSIISIIVCLCVMWF